MRSLWAEETGTLRAISVNQVCMGSQHHDETMGLQPSYRQLFQQNLGLAVAYMLLHPLPDQHSS